MEQIIAAAIHHHHVAKHHVDLRMPLEKLSHRRQRAGEILLITIQIRKNIALCLAQAAVDGVVHAPVLFHESLHPAVLRQPVQRAVIGAGVLHDMFHLHALIGNGGDAQFEPGGTAKTGSDDGDGHGNSEPPRVTRSGATGTDRPTFVHRAAPANLKGVKTGDSAGAFAALRTPPLTATLKPARPAKSATSEYNAPKTAKKKMTFTIKYANRKRLRRWFSASLNL